MACSCRKRSADRQLDFIYGPEHQRIRQIVSLSANAPSNMHSGTTWYLHGDNNDLFYEKKEQRADGTIEHKHYLSAGGITFAIQTIREGNLNGKPQNTLSAQSTCSRAFLQSGHVLVS